MARRSRRPRGYRTPTPRRRRIPRRLTPALFALLLLGLGVVGLERVGRLPEPVAGVVREAEAGWLAPLLAELGVDWPGGGARRVALPTTADERAATEQVLALLDDVSVEPEQRQGYTREDWPHWLDADGDCLDTRHEVLMAESLEPVQLAFTGCAVTAGQWDDPFTGEAITDPAALDVDHLVPLAEAHRSGGHAWSRERRAAYANDLDDPRSLTAVLAAANRSKGDQGPEDWLPPDPANHCRYAVDWVAVKARWGLSMDERERITLGNLLRACLGR